VKKSANGKKKRKECLQKQNQGQRKTIVPHHGKQQDAHYHQKERNERPEQLRHRTYHNTQIVEKRGDGSGGGTNTITPLGDSAAPYRSSTHYKKEGQHNPPTHKGKHCLGERQQDPKGRKGLPSELPKKQHQQEKIFPKKQDREMKNGNKAERIGTPFMGAPTKIIGRRKKGRKKPG